MKYLVLDIGGSAIKYAVMTKELEFLERGSEKTPLDSIDSFVNVIGSIYYKYKGDICGMAISMPGLLDSKKGYAYTGGALEYNNGQNIVEILKKRCNTEITIENDGKCAALAELWKGSLKDYSDGIVIVLGTGVGGGIIKDGKVHRGKSFFAGEFSFVWTNDNGEKGNINNWWGAKNGTRALTEAVAIVKGLPKDKVDGHLVFEYANNGDSDVLKILDKFTYDLAIQIYNLKCILDNEIVAIGGGISSQDILLKYIKKNVDKVYDIVGLNIPKPEITRCKFKNDANLIGALYNFLGLENLDEIRDII